MLSLLLLIFQALLVHCGQGDNTFGFQQSKNGTFINPVNGVTHPDDYPQNPVYVAGDQLEISWSTSMNPVDVLLAQPDTRGVYGYDRLAQNASISSLKWQISAANHTTYPIGPMFFLAVFQSGSPSDYFTSHFFNISAAVSRPVTQSTDLPTSPSAAASAPPSTTSSLSPSATSSVTSPADSPTSSPTTTSTQATSAGVVAVLGTASASQSGQVILAATSTADPTHTPSPDMQSAGLSAGAIGGIAAGAVAFLLIPMALFAVIYHKRKIRAVLKAHGERLDSSHSLSPANPGSFYSGYGPGGSVMVQELGTGLSKHLHELHGNHFIAEAPNNECVRRESQKRDSDMLDLRV